MIERALLLGLWLISIGCDSSPVRNTQRPEVPPNQQQTARLQSGEVDYRIEVRWTEGPALRRDSFARVQLSAPSEDLARLGTELDLVAFAWMAGDGHDHPGSLRFSVGSELGLFYLERVFFNMPGRWQIHFELYERPNRRLVARTAVEVVL